jgi:hypothetical protein
VTSTKDEVVTDGSARYGVRGDASRCEAASGLIQAAERTSGSKQRSKLKLNIGLRLHLAAALRELAARVEPAVDTLSGSAARSTYVAVE